MIVLRCYLGYINRGWLISSSSRKSCAHYFRIEILLNRGRQLNFNMITACVCIIFSVSCLYDTCLGVAFMNISFLTKRSKASVPQSSSRFHYVYHHLPKMMSQKLVQLIYFILLSGVFIHEVLNFKFKSYVFKIISNF
jgi:hypothetical protein